MTEREKSDYQKSLTLFSEHVAAAARSSEKLRAYYGLLILRYPFKLAEIETLPVQDEVVVYAFLKKFEQLIVLLNDNIFKQLPAFDLENTGKMSRFDNIIYAEKVGILRSAQRFVDAVALRNALAHEYPLDSGKQADLINKVIVEADVLLQAFQDLQNYVDKRLPFWRNVRSGSSQ